MLVSVQNLTTSFLSTDVGLLAPGESKSLQLGPNAAYRAAEGLKTLSDAGRVTVTISEETGKLDSLEPAAVGTASAADASITAAKLASDAVTTVKILDSNVTAAKLGSLAVTTAKINTAAVTAAKALVFQSTEQTGTGSNQNIAHGLAVTPTVVMWSLTDAPAGAFTVVPGTHTSTNVILNATSGLKFVVFCWS